MAQWQTGQHKVRVGCVLFHENRLLLMRQNQKPFWVFPGGTLELGESLGTCLVRELEEEAGLSITPGPLLVVTELIQANRHVVDVFFAATLASEQAVPQTWQAPHPENIDAIAWLSQAELSQQTVMPPMVDAFVRQHWDRLSQGYYPSAVYIDGA